MARFREGLPAPDVCGAAREVVLIASSSRGGSTIFAELLRRNPSLLHFRAEINPALRLFGCDGIHDDHVPADWPVPAGLSEALGMDCGHPTSQLSSDTEVEAFVREIGARLCLQWPTNTFSLEPLRADVHAVLAALTDGAGWTPGEFRDASAFYGRLLPRIRARHPEVHPSAYDIDRAQVGTPEHPFLPAEIVEEPPFVLPVPWIHATEAELATRPLVVKTPGNVYRLDWIQRLFPHARVRILHLVRNAAASINGLYDGWRFPGFHSHDVGGLAIPGYSDVVPGGHRWWKFDRPPGWADFKSAPLERVCAYQWTSAHRAVLAHPDRFVLRFEDVVGGPERQVRAIGRLAHWLNLPVETQLAHTLRDGLPVVMATAQPRHRRWFDRAAIIEPLCLESEVQTVMHALGYPDSPAAWE